MEFKRLRDHKTDETAASKHVLINPDLKENWFLKQVDKEIQHYSNSLSRMIRLLSESKKYVAAFATADNNCFVLEFHMVIMFEAFRRWLLKAVTAKIYESYKLMKDMLSEGEAVQEKYGLPQECPIQSSSPISAMLQKSHKKFIKRKINLQPKVILSDQVLLEFFQEGYPLNYNSNTFFCRKYYLCTSPDKESKQSRAIIVIDVNND